MADETFIDPLGRAIVFHDHTWFGHVLKGHPELRDERECVGATIEQPTDIRHSLSDTYVRLYHGQAERPGVYLRVVADVEIGVVKTAHYVRKPQGGPIEWLR
jgi:hypothetical protein